MKALQISLLFLFVGLLSCHPSATQSGVNTEGTSSTSVSKISFSTIDFRDENAEAIDVDLFKLNIDKYLNIHFTLQDPLLSSLRLLDKDMLDEELISNGNFQFTFLVDGAEVFKHNLHPGAGLPEDKMNRLEYTNTLLYPERIDYWGWYLWLRFMKMNGGQDVLDSGEHTLEIVVRTYLSGEETKVGAIIAQGKIQVAVTEVPYDKQLVKVQSIAPDSGWELSKEIIDHQKIEELNKKIAQNRFENINGIVVIKNGKLLLEEYFNEAERETLHNPRSVGKTIASTVMGIAINEGYFTSEGQQLKEFYDLKKFDNYDSRKEQITLRSLLTMSSNFLGNDDDYDSPGNEENMYPTDDWVKFTLDLPINGNKVSGRDFEYMTAGVVVLGDIIDKSVPGGLVKYTDDKFFKPLGITERNWQYTPQDVGNTAGGLQLRAVDFAKWGQVYKNNGQWNGQQLIPSSWVEESLKDQVEHDYGTYGYLFWNSSYTVDGVEYSYSACSGNGGNKIYIFKDLPLVIAITASAYGMPYAHIQVDQMMEEYILPSVLQKE